MRTSPIARLLIGGSHSDDAERPLTMMCGVVGERASRRNQVVSEVAAIGGRTDDWRPGAVGPSTAIRGPTRQDASRAQHPPFIFFPRPWKIDGTVDPGERKRSLFTVVVYTAKLKLRGRFAPPRMGDVRPVPDLIHWDRATISLGVGDPRGIASAPIRTGMGRPSASSMARRASACSSRASRHRRRASHQTGPNHIPSSSISSSRGTANSASCPRQRNDRAADVELAASKLRRHRAGSAASR